MNPDADDAGGRAMWRCACGQGHAPALCQGTTEQEQIDSLVEGSLLRALFPRTRQRRAFLQAVGHKTAMAAIASVIPLATLKAIAQERRAPEKKDLKLGFVAITCATPLLMAAPLGFYKAQGLNVQLVKTPGWGVIRERIISREHDASHFLSPMPIAMALGLGSAAVPTSVATIQNTNGQAITLHVKHKGKREPRSWKGFKFGVPFPYSMHNLLLRYYLAEFGVNPDADVEIVTVPPPEMVNSLRSGAIDGFLGPDPFNQRAVFDEVGFIHILSKEIWDGHPCCAFGVRDDFVAQNPGSFAALFRAIINASLMVSVSTDRAEIARQISPPAFLNQPEEVVTQVLTGRFPDGLGNVRTAPDRAMFDPIPWQSMAVWMLTQMKRWGLVKGEINFADVAEKVFMLTEAKQQMKLIGWQAPEGNYRRVRIMGKIFDATRPDEYIKGFALPARAG